jgi:hypothetical protein
MIAWARTADGWALNLDGTDGSRSFSLPRLELHSGPAGWTGICHLPDGTSRSSAIVAAPTVLAAKRAAVEEARRTLGPPWEEALREVV